VQEKMAEFMGKGETHPAGEFFIHVMIVIDDDPGQIRSEISFHIRLLREVMLRFNIELQFEFDDRLDIDGQLSC